jgi:hypothetical protein
MTSKDPSASNSSLLYLIYQHLKENGYQKAANVLKKHVTQVCFDTIQLFFFSFQLLIKPILAHSVFDHFEICVVIQDKSSVI